MRARGPPYDSGARDGRGSRPSSTAIAITPAQLAEVDFSGSCFSCGRALLVPTGLDDRRLPAEIDEAPASLRQDGTHDGLFEECFGERAGASPRRERAGGAGRGEHPPGPPTIQYTNPSTSWSMPCAAPSLHAPTTQAVEPRTAMA